MSYVNIETYAGDFEYRLIADIAKNGTHTIKLPKPLTGFSDDAEISFVVADGGITVADSDLNFRIGTEFTPPCFVEAGTAQSLIRVVLTDCQNGTQIYDIRQTDNITVGVSLKETIAYTLEGRASINDNVYYTIKKNGSDAFIEPSAPLPIIFLNNKLIKTAAPLKYGAQISVLGLSVIYLGDSLAVYNPCGLVTTKLPAADENALPEASPREEIVFKRVARIYSGVRKKKFTVEQPESPAAEEKLPAALVVGPSITMGISMLASVGMSIMNSGNNTASIIMAASMLAGTALWPNLMRAYTKKAKIAKEADRQRRYTAYLTDIESELEENAVKNLNALQFAAASAGDITGWIENKMLRRIWERSVSDDDFLKVRIGTGKIANPSEIGFPHTTYLNKDDILLQKSEEIKKKYKYLSGAPVTIDMKTTNSVGIIGMNVLVRFTAINLALQLAALHDSSELKMAFFYNGGRSKDFEWIKKLPHCWNEDMTFRYIAESPSESAVVVRELLEILSTRVGTRQNTAVSPSYVLFFIDPGITEDIAMRNFINTDWKASGFASVFAFGEMSDIPIGVKALIQSYSDKSSYYTADSESGGFSDLTRDNIVPADIEKFSREISLFRMSAAGAGIPGTVSFLDMFSAGNVQELDVARRWRMSNPAKSLAAPIGIKSGGEPFMLDIHEKYHGSHGLMAGTTGSGKSECIQAIILSLAVTFHPDDLCFVLIDFKGGGMANLFDGIPHLAGTITNLGNFIKRSMISLEAEMLKRQNMLKDAGVNHIDKYQKLYKEGTVSEPMPHMVLISDEFAELKQQQPEFMAELISVARIGRSLGVHLILATQKPTGVVDDQIWSNTRFRICLKVADKGDSNGMIGVPDAAAITKAGRGYVQVGYNEVFEQIQSAYTGAEYRPTEKYINTETMQVEQIDGAGAQTKSAAMKAKTMEIPGTDPKNMPNQLEAVVGYIAQVSGNLGLAPRPIWKEPLPLILSVDKLADKRENATTERYVLAGIIDDPYTQNIWDMKISLDDGHIAVYGTPGCGKTVFLQTIIFDLAKTYSPSDINFELIDFGGGSLDIFKGAPHTKHVITAQESDLVTDVLQLITEEIDVRKSKFAAVRQESLAKYIKESKENLPTIIIAVDNWAKFAEESPDGAQIIYQILKEGAKYGIIVALTLGGTNSISYKYTDYFSERFALQMSDAIEYAGVVGNTRGVFPMDTKGRGLIRFEGKVLEYQTAIAYGEPDDAARSRQIQAFLYEKYGRISDTAANVSGNISSGAVGSTAANVSEKVASTPKSAAKAVTAPRLPSMPTIGGNAKKKKVPLTAFSPENEQGVAVASSRLSGAVYRVPYGANMCIISAADPDPTITASIAAKEKRTVLYCGNVTSGDSKGYVTEADLHEMVSGIKGSEVIIIENFMSFYRAITDADLDVLVGYMNDSAKNLTVIAAVKATDGSALKDQPMGILVMKRDARGMLVSGKAMDCASVMPGEAVMAMSLDERNFVTSSRMALIYEADGAFEKIIPMGV